MVTLDEATLDNVLVTQKAAIRKFLAEEEYRPVIDSLMVVGELWAMCDYAYKGEEILIELIRYMPDAGKGEKNRETYMRAQNLLNWFSERVTQRQW